MSLDPQIPHSLDITKKSAKKDKSWTGQKLSLWWIFGLLGMVAFSIFCSCLRVRATGANMAYGYGVLLGGLLWPIIIIALFSLSKYFRQGPKRLALVAMILFGLFGFSSVSTTLREKDGDQKAMAHLQAEIEQLRRNYGQSQNAEEQAKIQEQLGKLISQTAENMSSYQAKEDMIYMRELMQPLMEERRLYDQVLAEFTNVEGGWMIAHSKTKETLSIGRKRAVALRQACARCDKILQAIIKKVDNEIENHGAASRPSLPMLKEYRASYGKNAQSLRELAEINDRIWERVDVAFALLHDEWGQWERATDGAVLWKTEALMQKYQTIITEIDSLASRQTALETSVLKL